MESLLASIVDAHAGDFGLTAEESVEIDRRMAAPDPEYADSAEVQAIFRRYCDASIAPGTR